MKRILIGLLIVAYVLTFSAPTLAAPLDLTGGINDEYNYSEIVFISGQAIKFSGTFKAAEKETDKLKKISCKFSLTPEDKSIKGKLERKVNYEINYAKYSDKGQTIGDREIKSYSETITLDKDKYTLVDYQYSQSDVIDNRPASDYYSGTLKARKTYTLNKNEGKVIVEISGGDVGYDNFWGSTETQVLEYTLDAYRDLNDKAAETAGKNRVSWQGAINIVVSDSTNKVLQYDYNQANLSSFNGGHMRVTGQEMVCKYEFDLPYMIPARPAVPARPPSPAVAAVPAIPDNVKRNRNVIELSRQMVPRVERLIIPRFRDTGGHWAEEDINQLYSLDVFAGDSQFFLPDIPMTRLDFVRAVVKATDMRPKQPEKKAAGKKAQAEASPFIDVQTTDADYLFVKEALDKRLISVNSARRFNPGAELTKAQAITILIKALGFESKAPNPGYVTSFADDAKIPVWSKDSIYVAQEIGLVQGDSFNRIDANRALTRAEASALLNKFLDILQRDLQKDYRDNIVLYY